MAWTAETEDLLRRLWLAGKTASQIAAALGDGVTRNAVIGKIHRLHLTHEPVEAAEPQDPPAAQLPPPRPPKSPAAEAKPTPAPPVASPPEPAPFVAEPLPDSFELTGAALAIWTLSPCGCRYPLGEPASEDFRFCNAVKPDDLAPYCAEHSAKVSGPGTPSERRALEGYQLGSFKKQSSLTRIYR
jgi:GcrA cell cycle regulator